MSTAAAAAAPPPTAVAATPSDPSKAILKQALQQRLAALERTLAKNGAATTATAAAAAAHVPSAAARPAPAAAAASPTAPLSALDAAKALLAAKIAAKEARLAASPSPSPSPTPSGAANASVASAAAASTAPVAAVPAAKSSSAGLSAHAKPFLPASAAAASAAASSSAATAAPALASSSAASAPSPVVSAHKPLLCRSWLTCTFGPKCRFRHPNLSTEPFFEYGGEVLLHLNALASATAAQSAMPEPSSYAAPVAMPPVLLLILTLILQAGAAESGGAASLPLLQLWLSLKDQLAGCKDLPANQDDMLNTMGLPTTASVLTRAAEGQVVLSTEAFRNMYASVFSICRQAGTFLVTHQWDEERRQQLQNAIDAQRKSQEQRKGTKRTAPASTTAQAFTTSSAATTDPDDDNRKRKRVTDAELEARGALSSSRRLGEAYPEEQSSAAPMSMRPASAAAAAAPASRPSLSHSTSSGHYSMDAGAELGGATSFVRGGIVTELSLLSSSAAQQQRARQQQAAMDDDDDPFTRAIRRQNQVSTHATYTVRTKKIDSGKGFDMLQKMNWRNGQGLGKRKQGRVEPVEVKFRADRTGL